MHHYFTSLDFWWCRSTQWESSQIIKGLRRIDSSWVYWTWLIFSNLFFTIFWDLKIKVLVLSLFYSQILICGHLLNMHPHSAASKWSPDKGFSIVFTKWPTRFKRPLSISLGLPFIGNWTLLFCFGVLLSENYRTILFDFDVCSLRLWCWTVSPRERQQQVSWWTWCLWMPSASWSLQHMSTHCGQARFKLVCHCTSLQHARTAYSSWVRSYGAHYSIKHDCYLEVEWVPIRYNESVSFF